MKQFYCILNLLSRGVVTYAANIIIYWACCEKVKGQFQNLLSSFCYSVHWDDLCKIMCFGLVKVLFYIDLLSACIALSFLINERLTFQDLCSVWFRRLMFCYIYSMQLNNTKITVVCETTDIVFDDFKALKSNRKVLSMRSIVISVNI